MIMTQKVLGNRNPDQSSLSVLNSKSSSSLKQQFTPPYCPSPSIVHQHSSRELTEGCCQERDTESGLLGRAPQLRTLTSDKVGSHLPADYGTPVTICCSQVLGLPWGCVFHPARPPDS